MNARKDQLKSLLLNPQQQGPAPEVKSAVPPKAPPEDAPVRPVSGSVRAMGLSLERLGAAAREAEQLRVRLAEGEAVIEIEPSRIAPSFAADRMEDGAGQGWRDDDEAFAAFLADIRDHGQQSPILVRPHPNGEGLYQIAYGHRRWRAAVQLGRTVKAVVRSLSDAELVVAQGQENAQRRDLSFIEKAFFALHLDERGFDRATLIAALAVQTAEITRLLQVAKSIPADIALLIGPAPKAGRPRWMALAEGLRERSALSRVRAVLEAEKTRKLPSDQRFQRAFSVLAPPSRPDRQEVEIRSAAGEILARYARTPHGDRLLLDDGLSPEFARFVASELPALFERWRAAKP